MSLRLIEVFLPNETAQKVPELLQEHPPISIWQADLANGQTLFKILLFALEAEAVIELLEIHFSQTPGFRIILLSVEASIPYPERPEETVAGSPEILQFQQLEPQTSRINRQELYADVTSSVVLNWNHILLVLLSAIIAAIGLQRNDGTIIIGAMVIAPLIGTNMALALATTLGDITLVRRAIKIGAIGIAVVISFSVIFGYMFPVSPEIPEIASRTKASWSDVVLAFAAGGAGAVSFTSGTTSAIVGVMVAVALLPPLVTFGMLLGAGHWQVSLGAILLLLTNLICLNLAGVIVFSVQKLHPRKWWEASKAYQVTRTAFWLWLILLSVLIVGIVLWQRNYQLSW